MEASLPLLFAAVIGFGHAFEADHILAVSNIVTKRNQLLHAIKDGIYWGLGHTSTIFVIGLIMILGKASFLPIHFKYMEGMVGIMLIILGVVRLVQYKENKNNNGHEEIEDNHRLAYGIGLVHGLAGSGAMILLVMTKIDDNLGSLLYLFIFGIGSVLGMLVAAGLCSLPFSKNITTNRFVQLGLILFSSLLCIGYGAYMVSENLAL